MSLPKVELTAQGIVRVEYPLHTEVTLELVQYEYQQRLEISRRALPLMVVLNGVPLFTPEAQAFLASDKPIAITSAAAVVVVPQSGYYEHTKDLLSLFQLRAHFPFPYRVTDSEKEALNWLLEQS